MTNLEQSSDETRNGRSVAIVALWNHRHTHMPPYALKSSKVYMNRSFKNRVRIHRIFNVFVYMCGVGLTTCVSQWLSFLRHTATEQRVQELQEQGTQIPKYCYPNHSLDHCTALVQRAETQSQ